MVIAAFFIASAFVILALGALQAQRKAAEERERRALETELASFLHGLKVPDAEHAEGVWQGMPLKVGIGHYAVTFEVKLTPAVIPYKELLARHAPELAGRLAEVGLTLDDHDVVRGELPRESALPETLVSLENRLPLVAAVRDLRRFAPGALVERLERARSSYDIDSILIELTQHFPDAPEVEVAIELAAERDHQHPDRVRERAERWLGRSGAAH